MRALLLGLILGLAAALPAAPVSISLASGCATLEAEDGSQGTWRGAVLLRTSTSAWAWNLRGTGMGSTRAEKLAHLRAATFEMLVISRCYQRTAQDRTAFAAEFDSFVDAVITAAEAR